MSLPAHFTLNDGEKIPTVGMGCWMGEPGGGERAYTMCTKALKAGYRHFDTASGYANEKYVGNAIHDSGIPRNELYIVTKLPNTDHDKVEESIKKSLLELRSDYIDLYLVHWPQAVVSGKVIQPEESPTIVETWKQMEKLLKTGKVKSIGVSNFSIKTLSLILENCTIFPAVNQVELHPCLPQEDLKLFCESKGITLTAYSPLGRSMTLLEHSVVNSIARRQSITPAQVLLSWAVQRSTVVIPKSENEERMKTNAQLVPLTLENFEALNSIHREPDMHKSLLKFHRDDGTVFGWTYGQLGWGMAIGGRVKSVGQE